MAAWMARWSLPRTSPWSMSTRTDGTSTQSPGNSSARAAGQRVSTANARTAGRTSRMAPPLFLLPALPGQPRAVHAELHQPLLLHFRDVDRPAVGAAEAEVARRGPQDVHLAQHLTLRRYHRHRALAVARDVEVAVRVAAHAVESVVVELLQ